MSVHIISKGTKERTKYRVECPECGCVYEYNKEDIKVDNYEGFAALLRTYCPQCGWKVNHDVIIFKN